ncbi:MAG: HAD-IA family hydrolase [Oleibacter sp.]|nr:HAD-IA family hydrolase [Thalassolituus sp.]
MTDTFQPPKAVLFDLDGTLVDTAPDFFEVVNHLRQEQGMAVLPNTVIREQVSNGGIALACLTFEVTRDHDEIQTLRQRLLDQYALCIGNASHYFAGFPKVLAYLQERHIPWGIVTNKPKTYTVALLKALNIDAASVVCPEDVKHAKPAPDSLLLAAQQLGVSPDLCWYVGDHKRDIDAARAANMVAIAARFGYIEAEDDMNAWQADVYIDNPLELIEHIAASFAD